MTPEYHEGPEATKRFEQGMSRLFKVQKETLKDKPLPPKLKHSVRKPQTQDRQGA